MNNEPLQKIEHRGLIVEIYQDESYQDSPDDWGDTDLFLVGFHRDFTVEREGFDIETCRALVDITDHSDEMIDRVKELNKKYHHFGLEAYIHSGVSLALSSEGNFPDRQWDVSQLGLVFVSKEHAKSRAQARKSALGLIKVWNQNLSGDVYGFNIDGGDSCWGFYGIESAIEAGKESADWTADELLKKKLAKTRAKIINRVPLMKRV